MGAVIQSNQQWLLWKGCHEHGLGKDGSESVAFMVSTGYVSGFSQNTNPDLRLSCEADPLETLNDVVNILLTSARS